MIGYLVWKMAVGASATTKRRSTAYIFCELRCRAHPHTARGGRLQRKAMEVLRRNGVSRFLNPELVGARKVATGPLWRAMAAPLALTGLTACGVPREEALVALHAGPGGPLCHHLLHRPGSGGTGAFPGHSGL